MSSNTPPATEAYFCQQCGGPRSPDASVGGSFCSERCLYRHKGEKALRQIRSDHRFCATCFRRLKTVSRPADSRLEDAGLSRLTREAFVGYQYRTEHATDGVDEVAAEERPSDRRLAYSRTSCECGTVDPSDRHEVLRQLDPKQTVQSLWRCLVELERDGTLTHRPSRGAYLEALRKTDLDWSYAIGRALHADG